MHAGAALTAAAVAVLCCGCERHVRISKQMTWQCAPDQRDPAYPEAEAVVFTYVEEPACFEIVSGRRLCRRLELSGRKEVTVDFDAWGSPSRGLRGYNIQAIDGKPVEYAGGPGGSGKRGETGACPLEVLFR
jgi:hypothetical protein